MNERTEVRFKPAIFSKEHKMILDPEFIELYKDENDTSPVRFSKLEFDAFRFGIKWLRGYKTIFGRVYCIDIRSATEEIIKIRLTSVYGVGRKTLGKKYNEIITAILKLYISDIIGQYLKTFNYKQPFSILNIHFDQEGIILNNKHKISWNDIDIRKQASFA